MWRAALGFNGKFKLSEKTRTIFLICTIFAITLLHLQNVRIKKYKRYLP